MILKAVKYRLYPTEEQCVLLDKHIGCCRLVYNLALETKEFAYSAKKVNLSCHALIKQLPELKKEYNWLKEINSQSLQQSIGHLDVAFSSFFKGNAAFPKFKTKRKSKQTYGLQPFTMQVLTRERTFYEKLLSLTRLSYSGVDKLKEKIRHFYDIYQLFQIPDLRETLFEPENLKLIEHILQEDKSNPTFRGDWEDKKLSDAPIITQFDEIWKILAPTYENEMSKLLWGKLPPAVAIQDSFQKIRNLLIVNQL